jgi:hypothetical protein
LFFANSDKPIPGSHDDRLFQVHPPAFADGRRRQSVQPFAGAGLDPEYGDPPSGLNSRNLKSGDDPVFGESESKAGIFVKGHHRSFSPRHPDQLFLVSFGHGFYCRFTFQG